MAIIEARDGRGNIILVDEEEARANVDAIAAIAKQRGISFWRAFEEELCIEDIEGEE